MLVPLRAIEDAYKAFSGQYDHRHILDVLEAGAAAIKAQALQEAGAAAYALEDGSVVDTYRSEVSDWLSKRADELDPRP